MFYLCNVGSIQAKSLGSDNLLIEKTSILTTFMCDNTTADEALSALREIVIRRPDLYEAWGSIAVVAQSVIDQGKLV